jgi:hypothetical protein
VNHSSIILSNASVRESRISISLFETLILPKKEKTTQREESLKKKQNKTTIAIFYHSANENWVRQ